MDVRTISAMTEVHCTFVSGHGNELRVGLCRRRQQHSVGLGRLHRLLLTALAIAAIGSDGNLVGKKNELDFLMQQLNKFNYSKVRFFCYCPRCQICVVLGHQLLSY